MQADMCLKRSSVGVELFASQSACDVVAGQVKQAIGWKVEGVEFQKAVLHEMTVAILFALSDKLFKDEFYAHRLKHSSDPSLFDDRDQT